MSEIGVRRLMMLWTAGTLQDRECYSGCLEAIAIQGGEAAAGDAI